MTLEERVAFLEQIIGTQFVTARDTGSLSAELKTENQLPTGQYPYILSDYQIRVGIASLAAEVAAIPEVPPPIPITSGDVVTQLAAYGINIAQGKLAIGMMPDMNYNAQLQIGGGGSASILGRSNMQGLDGQNPGEVHTSQMVVSDNDGGIRLIQYLGWGAGGKIRNTTNRRASVLAIDSMGDVCKSTQEIGSDQDGGQSWYIRTQGNIVEVCTYKVGAFIRILKSVAQYGSTDSQQL